jgi:hypothetical protein
MSTAPVLNCGLGGITAQENKNTVASQSYFGTALGGDLPPHTLVPQTPLRALQGTEPLGSTGTSLGVTRLKTLGSSLSPSIILSLTGHDCHHPQRGQTCCYGAPGTGTPW